MPDDRDSDEESAAASLSWSEAVDAESRVLSSVVPAVVAPKPRQAEIETERLPRARTCARAPEPELVDDADVEPIADATQPTGEALISSDTAPLPVAAPAPETREDHVPRSTTDPVGGDALAAAAGLNAAARDVVAEMQAAEAPVVEAPVVAAPVVGPPVRVVGPPVSAGALLDLDTGGARVVPAGAAMQTAMRAPGGDTGEQGQWKSAWDQKPKERVRREDMPPSRLPLMLVGAMFVVLAIFAWLAFLHGPASSSTAPLPAAAKAPLPVAREERRDERRREDQRESFTARAHKCGIAVPATFVLGGTVGAERCIAAGQMLSATAEKRAAGFALCDNDEVTQNGRVVGAAVSYRGRGTHVADILTPALDLASLRESLEAPLDASSVAVVTDGACGDLSVVLHASCPRRVVRWRNVPVPRGDEGDKPATERVAANSSLPGCSLLRIYALDVPLP